MPRRSRTPNQAVASVGAARKRAATSFHVFLSPRPWSKDVIPATASQKTRDRVLEKSDPLETFAYGDCPRHPGGDIHRRGLSPPRPSAITPRYTASPSA